MSGQFQQQMSAKSSFKGTVLVLLEKTETAKSMCAFI